jgi:hypothetical protein
MRRIEKDLAKDGRCSVRISLTHAVEAHITHCKDFKILSFLPLRFWAFLCCSSRTSRIVPIACQWQKSGLITRNGIRGRKRALGGVMAKQLERMVDEKGWRVWKSWESALWRGERF